MVRTVLEHKGLPTKLWAEAVAMPIHILNRSPTTSTLGKTPYKAFFGKKPDVSYFHVFGCDAYTHPEGGNGLQVQEVDLCWPQFPSDTIQVV